MSAVEFLAGKCNVPEAVARVALHHSKGSIPRAIELLNNEMALQFFYREAREYGIES